MASSLKKIAVLGSTGSIGRQTLDVIRAFPDRLRVTALAGGKNAQLLAEQIAEFRPAFVSCADQAALFNLKPQLRPGDFRAVTIEEMAALPDVDVVVVATSGNAGVIPTLAAIRARKTVALANKEALVVAGSIVTSEAARYGVTILPIDSEHSAIWQCLQGEKPESVSGIVLTASGGPFRDAPRERLASVKAGEALKHPTWKMGPKVTIDSATLVNKGLEAIEARWLFSVPLERVRILIHPESIIHSMVEFRDGSTKAQLSRPDMRLPIQYALCYPERLPNEGLGPIDWSKLPRLTFAAPDLRAFPGLRLALEAGAAGGTCPAVFCAADEVAVEWFLSGRIAFPDISRLIEETLSRHQPEANPTLDEIWEADAWAREFALNAKVGSSAI